MKYKSNLVFDLYQKMTKQKIVSAYHGDFSYKVVNMLLKQAKWDLHYRKADIRTTKKTYGILVECLENIVKHNDILGTDPAFKPSSEGIVILSHNDTDYYVTVGNLVKNTEIKTLKEKIDGVNTLDKRGLQQKHEHMLRTGTISEKGGAGLGIIYMAMKSGNKLAYDFIPYDNEYSFFSLQVTISGAIN